MSINDPISSIMTEEVISVKIRTSLDETERIMRKHHIRHLPVLKKGKLVGMISLTDLLRLSFADNFGGSEFESDAMLYDMLTLDQLMVNDPISVQSHQSIREAAEILAKHEFHALPVLDGEELVGIVTTTDLIKFLLTQAEKA